uniref:Uncharacterized protein n=1 Tax=Arundo donax TaxID=35708 RepID=A0A0A8YP94_ARUDO
MYLSLYDLQLLSCKDVFTRTFRHYLCNTQPANMPWVFLFGIVFLSMKV